MKLDATNAGRLMNPADKPEYPPLLQRGFCGCSLVDLRELCVDRFPLSTSRPQIMNGLSRLCRRLTKMEIDGDLWIDGSFLTEKIEPEDVDIVLHLESTVVEAMSFEQMETVDWLKADRKQTHSCHSFVFATFPEGDGRHVRGRKAYEFWLGWFGTSRRGELKGIAVLRLRDLRLKEQAHGFRLRLMHHSRMSAGAARHPLTRSGGIR